MLLYKSKSNPKKHGQYEAAADATPNTANIFTYTFLSGSPKTICRDNTHYNKINFHHTISLLLKIIKNYTRITIPSDAGMVSSFQPLSGINSY
jgi:hypothetical protein